MVVRAVVVEVAVVFQLRLYDPFVVQVGRNEYAGPLGRHDEPLVECIGTGLAAEPAFAVEQAVITVYFHDGLFLGPFFLGMLLFLYDELVRRRFLFGSCHQKGAKQEKSAGQGQGEFVHNRLLLPGLAQIIDFLPYGIFIEIQDNAGFLRPFRLRAVKGQGLSVAQAELVIYIDGKSDLLCNE